MGKSEDEKSTRKGGLLDSRQVKLQYLLNKFKKSPNDQNFAELSVELHSVKYFSDRFASLQKKLNLSGKYSNLAGTNFDCYKQVVGTLNQTCGKMTESSYGNYKFLYELCATHTTEQAVQHIAQMCWASLFFKKKKNHLKESFFLTRKEEVCFVLMKASPSFLLLRRI